MLDVGDAARCDSAADCRVRTKDCCECNGDVTPSGLMAVNTTFTAPAGCDGFCDECIADYPDGVTALCDENGSCALDFGAD